MGFRMAPDGMSVHMVYRVSVGNKNGFTKTTYVYKTESIDFQNKSFRKTDFVEQLNNEEYITSLNDDGTMFLLTADKKANDLVFYELMPDGKSKRRSVHIDPSHQKKGENLHEYLNGLTFLSAAENSLFNQAASSVKLSGIA